MDFNEALEAKLIEDQINEILKSSKNTNLDDFKSFDLMEKEKNEIIEKVYSKFKYENNIQNKIDTLEQLSNYEYVEFEDINKKDYIKFLDTKYFFNLKLVNGGVVFDKLDKESLYLFKYNNYYISKSKYYFRRLTNEKIVKMKIVDILNEDD